MTDLPQRAEILTQWSNLFPQLVKNNVNDLSQRARNNVNNCKSPGTLVRHLVILSAVIAGRDIPNNKNQPTAHASYLRSVKVSDFFAIVKNSVLPR